MRNVPGILIIILSIGIAIAGCAGRSTEPAPAPAPTEATETAAPQAISLACTPPLRSCTACNGAQFCGRVCPFCPPPLAAPRPEVIPAVAELVPVGEQCGGIICAPGLRCCNPSCNICTAKGVQCTQQSCN